MNMSRALIVLLLAAVPAAPAFAQRVDEPVRLRLALDPDGSVRLSADPMPNAPPPLLRAPLPRPGLSDPAGPARMAIDLSASRPDSAGAVPCLSEGLLRMGPLAGCDAAGYGGLPGAIAGTEVLLTLDTGRGYGFNLDYGLDWLDHPERSGGLGDWLALGETGQPAAATLLPGWIGPVLGQSRIGSERFGLGGFLWLGPELRLDLGLEHAEGSALLFDPGAAAPWSQASQDSIALGLRYGRFHGGVIGRQLSPDQALGGVPTRSLDLGISWRMPWRAAIEFGARNLIVRPQAADGDEAKPDQGDLRTPYLRYHQEL
jgi:hypothetical protein